MANPRCLLARAQLAQYVAKLRESSTAEKAGTLVKAGYLASAKTILRNDIGNASFGGVEYLATRPLAVATDYIASVLKSASTFGKVQPHEFRQIANTLNVGGLARGATGIREGVAKAVQLLRTGVDASQLGEKFEAGQTTFKSPVLDKAVHGVFNFLEANDKPFFGFAFETSMYGRARLLGIREGLTGEKLAARTNELLSSPTEEMVLGAMSDAQYATFKNATALSDLAGSARTGLQAKAQNAVRGRRLGLRGTQLALDITLPFTKVASAIANAGIDYSPAGFVKALVQSADRDPLVQAQLHQQLARATIGSGLVMLGYAMQGNGTISGSASPNPGERAQADVENRPPNSVLIGGKWHNITFLGPLAIPLLLGAGIRKFSGSSQDTGLGAKAGYGLGTIGKTMTEQSYLQSLSNVIDALNDPANKGKSAVAGMVPIPSIISQTAQSFDPTQRSTETIGQKIQAKIPFASRALPPRLTQFGDTAKRQGGLSSFLDITNSKPSTATPVTDEMERLGVHVNAFDRSVRVPGQAQSVRRTPEEYNSILKEFGPIKEGMLSKIMASAAYQKADDDDKQHALESVLRDIQQAGTGVDKVRRLGRSVPTLRLQDLLNEAQAAK